MLKMKGMLTTMELGAIQPGHTLGQSQKLFLANHVNAGISMAFSLVLTNFHMGTIPTTIAEIHQSLLDPGVTPLMEKLPSRFLRY